MGLLAWLRGRTDDAPSHAAEAVQEAAEPAAPEPGPSDVYLSPQEAAHYFQRDAEGRLPVELRVIDREGWLVHPGTGRRVAPGNRALAAAGLFSCNVRGDDYYPDAATAGDCRPGAAANLEREGGNAHDGNALAVQALTAEGELVTVGYVNRALAAKLAKRLDAGEDLCAVFIRGSAPGKRPRHLSVAISDPETISYL